MTTLPDKTSVIRPVAKEDRRFISTERRIRAGLVVALLLVGVFVAHVFREIYGVGDSNADLIYSAIRANRIRALVSALKDAENGVHGYLLTGKRRYLEPYDSAMAEIRALRKELGNETPPIAELPALNLLLDRKIESMRRSVQTRDQEGFVDALQVIFTGEGRTLMDQLRAMLERTAQETERNRDMVYYRTREGVIKAFRHLSIGGLSIFAALILAAIFVLRSVGRLVRFERDLRHARAAAVAASEFKSRFLANMSHDMRTPLNAVVGMSRMLQESAMTDEQRSMVATLEGASNSLLSLVAELLDLSKIESGKLELVEVPFNLEVLLRDVMRVSEWAARDKGIALKFTAEGIQGGFYGDPDRLRQVFLNLLGNAVKFTDAGHVALSLAMTSVEGHKVQMSMRVQDTGIGIPPEIGQRIFEPFDQGDHQTARRFGGTGLGLSISRRIIELMGGEIHYESTVGQGSTFTVSVPLRRTEAPLLATQDEAMPPMPSKAKTEATRVIVADDDEIGRRISARELRKLGFNVDTVADGSELLKAFETKVYDLVVLDCRMPNVDGYEATRRIREQTAGRQVAIVALTASATVEDRLRCMEAGMDDYLVKPLDPMLLRRVVSRWLNPPETADTAAKRQS